MIDFANARAISTPRGEAVLIERGGEVLWRKQRYKRELAYLESTGTQYINTGVNLTSNHSVEIDYQLTVAQQYRAGIFGGLVSTGKTSRYGTLLSPTTAYLEYGYGAGNVYFQAGMPDTKRHLLRQEKNRVYADGSLVYAFEEATFAVDRPAFLGNFDFTNYTPAKARYFSSKWWDGDILIRDFIPVLDLNDRPCMYDRVTDRFFYNAGTGEFAYGELPRFDLEYQEVEYLESTGSQWFDTGMTINTVTDSVELVFQCTEGSVYKWFFGEHDNNARFGLGSGDGTNKRNVAYGSNTYKVSDSQIYDTKHTFVANGNGTFLDDARICGFSSFASTSTLYLFNLNLSGGSYESKAKVWSYVHKRNGETALSLVPCYRKSDGRPGMYDLANDKFYTNAGSGEFLLGPVV